MSADAAPNRTEHNVHPGTKGTRMYDTHVEYNLLMWSRSDEITDPRRSNNPLTVSADVPGDVLHHLPRTGSSLFCWGEP